MHVERIPMWTPPMKRSPLPMERATQVARRLSSNSAGVVKPCMSVTGTR
jgi:hypothetical protein